MSEIEFKLWNDERQGILEDFKSWLTDLFSEETSRGIPNNVISRHSFLIIESAKKELMELLGTSPDLPEEWAERVLSLYFTRSEIFLPMWEIVNEAADERYIKSIK